MDIDTLSSDELAEIYAHHKQAVDDVWAEDETGERTMGEAVKIWLRRMLAADPCFDWRA